MELQRSVHNQQQVWSTLSVNTFYLAGLKGYSTSSHPRPLWLCQVDDVESFGNTYQEQQLRHLCLLLESSPSYYRCVFPLTLTSWCSLPISISFPFTSLASAFGDIVTPFNKSSLNPLLSLFNLLMRLRTCKRDFVPSVMGLFKAQHEITVPRLQVQLELHSKTVKLVVVRVSVLKSGALFEWSWDKESSFLSKGM